MKRKKNTKKHGSAYGTTLRVASYLKPYRFLLTAAFLCALLNVFFTLAGPVLIGQAIDYIVGKGNVQFESVLKILLIFLGSITLAALFQWFLNIITNKISFGMVNTIRKELFQKLSYVPLKIIDSSSKGDIISRMVNDGDALSDGLFHIITQLTTGVMTILGTVIFMFTLNVNIALVVVLITPLSLVFAAFIGRISSKSFRQQQGVQGELSGFVEEMVGNQKVIKAFSYEGKSFKKFEEINNELYVCGEKAQFYSSISNPGTRIVNVIVYTAVGVIGAISALSGNLTIGQLSAFLTYANQYTKPFNEVTGVITQIQTAIAGAGRIFDFLDQENEVPDRLNAKELDNIKGRVDIENISFSYRKGQRLIEDFSLHVQPGQRVAIVGATGSGKTTLINLLMRFYDVQKGEIKIDKTPIADIKRSSLRSAFGMVLQETWLQNVSISENIAYGSENAGKDDIVNAAKAAYAHGFIKRLPNGYDTVISSEGGNLSSGQKQLLCIARVMLCDPPMLILDEATSSIDTLTEARIQKAFNKMMEGRTSFVVAHRLSTIKQSDIILVMDNGNVAEQGTHEQLLAKKGLYFDLWSSQWRKTV